MFQTDSIYTLYIQYVNMYESEDNFLSLSNVILQKKAFVQKFMFL